MIRAETAVTVIAVEYWFWNYVHRSPLERIGVLVTTVWGPNRSGLVVVPRELFLFLGEHLYQIDKLHHA